MRRIETRIRCLQVRKRTHETLRVLVLAIGQRIVWRNVGIVRARESRKQDRSERSARGARAQEDIGYIVEQSPAVWKSGGITAEQAQAANSRIIHVRQRTC